MPPSDPGKMKELKRLLSIGASFLRGKTVLSYFPSRLWLEVTSHCNLRCPLCPNQALPKEKKGFMDWDLFQKIVDQSAGKIHDIYLFHRGEPLLHPRLIEMIDYAEHRGIPTRIHTNATLLTESLSRRLLSSRLRMISFSFDGYDAASYEQNRPPSRFAETLAKIELFLTLKKESENSRIITVLQIMGLPPGSGGRAMEEFAARLKNQGLDRVVYRSPHNWGGLVSLSSPPPSSAKKTGCCTFPWYALVVYWDGTVGPCPQDFQGEMILGDLREETLEKIWNGDRVKELRRLLALRQYDQLQVCRTCDRPRRPQVAGIPLEYARTFLKENILGHP